MDYRDDRQAQKLRAERLEVDLGQAERDLSELEAKLLSHEALDKEQERELARLRKQVQQLGGGASKGKATRNPALAAVAIVILAGVGVILGLAGVVYATFIVMPQPSSSRAVGSKQATPPLPLTKRAEVSKKLASPPPPVLVWGARVLSETGGKVKQGEPCLLIRTPKATRLRCGSVVLYDSDEAFGSGMSNRLDQLKAFELPNQVGQVFSLSYRFTGNWTGPRSQLIADTRGQRAEVSAAGGKSWSVQLQLMPYSFVQPLPVDFQGSKLVFGSTLRRRMRLTKREGKAPVKIASSNCSLEITPARLPKSKLNCRVIVRCGPKAIYGADGAGFNTCRVAEGKAVAASDTKRSEKDKDPALVYDLEKKELLIEDGMLGETWKLHFTIEPPASCLPRQLFSGVLIDKEGKSQPAALKPAGTTFRWLLSPEGDEKSDVALRGLCQDGDLKLVGKESFTLSYGPDRATLGGVIQTQAGTQVVALMRR
jgi:hypothetical protein